MHRAEQAWETLTRQRQQLVAYENGRIMLVLAQSIGAPFTQELLHHSQHSTQHKQPLLPSMRSDQILASGNVNGEGKSYVMTRSAER